MPDPKLKFSHRSTAYVFIGDPIPPPPPGSYDAAAWTPPTHKVYSVWIQDDGMWELEQNGVRVASGDSATSNRSFAKRIVENYLSKLSASSAT